MLRQLALPTAAAAALALLPAGSTAQTTEYPAGPIGAVEVEAPSSVTKGYALNGGLEVLWKWGEVRAGVTAKWSVVRGAKKEVFATTTDTRSLNFDTSQTNFTRPVRGKAAVLLRSKKVKAKPVIQVAWTVTAKDGSKKSGTLKVKVTG